MKYCKKEISKSDHTLYARYTNVWMKKVYEFSATCIWHVFDTATYSNLNRSTFIDILDLAKEY